MEVRRYWSAIDSLKIDILICLFPCCPQISLPFCITNVLIQRLRNHIIAANLLVL